MEMLSHRPQVIPATCLLLCAQLTQLQMYVPYNAQNILGFRAAKATPKEPVQGCKSPQEDPSGLVVEEAKNSHYCNLQCTDAN